MSKQYIKLQNQGSILQNLQLLNDMANSEGFADKYGYFSKHAIAEIAIRGNIVTSAGKMGDDIIGFVNDESIKEENNSVLQNAKARMQILRILGLVATDYDSELYSITDFGKKLLKSVFPLDCNEIPNYTLLREAFMGITTTSETYEFTCDSSFDCRLGYEICYALASLNYKIGVEEMPLITACSVERIDEFIGVVKKYRNKKKPIPVSSDFFPKTQKNKPVKPVKNLTRTINQILRTCEIIDHKLQRSKEQNYYVCTEKGKKFADAVKKNWKKFHFWAPSEFRKKNLFQQKSICCLGYNNILYAGGFEVSQTSPKDVFSPYQLILETDADRFLGKEIRMPPENKEQKALYVNGLAPSQILKLKPQYVNQKDYESYIKKCITKDNLTKRIKLAQAKGLSQDALENVLLSECKEYQKNKFYPFIHSLLQIIGLSCPGEVGRFDALCEYKGCIIPVEIKSYTETPTYNLKGLRQAVENKIMSYRDKGDLKYASLVIGFSAPSNIEELKNFVDDCFQETRIKLIAIDAGSLIKMSVNTVWTNTRVDLDNLLQSYGFVEA